MKKKKSAALLEIGPAIRQVRQKSGISQGDIMWKTGIERGYVSRIERGEIPAPKLQTVMKICGVLGVTVDQLLF